jgi:hypothetical protein
METWSSLGQLSYQVSNLDDRVLHKGDGKEVIEEEG